jgi:carbonic anhydrase/acetyltransferase-like protein (isoleucine patch superfamily)
MPGSIVSGNCNLGDRVYLGTNSSVIEKAKVDSDVTLGMNSCFVQKEYGVPGIYVGVPAKLLTKTLPSKDA